LFHIVLQWKNQKEYWQIEEHSLPLMHFKKKMEELNIELSFTSVRHPQANPVERYMRELGRLGRAYCSEKHTSWYKFVSLFKYWKFHSTTQQVPIELQQQDHAEAMLNLVSFPPCLDIIRLPDLYEETLRETIKKAERRKSERIKHNNTEVYPVGTLVLLRSNKISSIEYQEVKKIL
jgi:hypothetical protein